MVLISRKIIETLDKVNLISNQLETKIAKLKPTDKVTVIISASESKDLIDKIKEKTQKNNNFIWDKTILKYSKKCMESILRHLKDDLKIKNLRKSTIFRRIYVNLTTEQIYKLKEASLSIESITEKQNGPS